MRATWKHVEAQVADRFGAKRVPITGRSRGSTADTDCKEFAQEIKHRKEIPLWIKDAINQAEEASKRHGGWPMVILHEKYSKYDDSLIIMKLSDFNLWRKEHEGQDAVYVQP